MGYDRVIKVSGSVKDALDRDKGEDENRNEQMERLLNGNDVPPPSDRIENRLKAIESVLNDVQQDRSEGMVKRIDRLENAIERTHEAIERIEAEVQG